MYPPVSCPRNCLYSIYSTLQTCDWCSCVYSPIYLWHTQQMITDPTNAALSAVASERTDQLAKHAVCSRCRQVHSAEVISLNNIWIYTVSQKRSHCKLSVTLSNLNRFSKFLHYWKAYKIRYKTNTTLPNSP